MKYSYAYLRAIAEFVCGTGNEKAIKEYVKNFDPSNPDCKADELRFLRFGSAEDETAKERQKFRNEDYFIRNLLYDFYTNEFKVPFAVTFKGKDKEEEISVRDLMDKWVTDSFSDGPLSYNEEIPYVDDIKAFTEKYGFSVNVDNIKKSVQEIAVLTKDKDVIFKQFYKCTFSAAAIKALDKNVPMDVFCRDFDKMMSAIRKNETGKDEIPSMQDKKYTYGGMKGFELKDFLLSFREKDNNLTEIFSEELKDLNGEEFSEYLLNRADGIMAENLDTQDKLVRITALYQVAEKINNGRSFFYKTFNKRAFNLEENAIKATRLCLKGLDKTDEVDNLLSSPTLYTVEYQKEIVGVHRLSFSALDEPEKFPLFADEVIPEEISENDLSERVSGNEFSIEFEDEGISNGK